MSKAKVAGIPGVDPTLPRVELKLGSDTYYLVFNFKALALAAAKLREKGVHTNLLQSLDLSGLDADTLAPLLYAGLITHQPEITLDEVVAKVSIRDLGGIFTAIAEAYTASLAEPTKAGAEGKA